LVPLVCNLEDGYDRAFTIAPFARGNAYPGGQFVRAMFDGRGVIRTWR
jgi:hypothetical protein